MSLSKDYWILLALKYAPLDRIHLMKALFLVWYRSGKNIPSYFEFEPYLYGPCSLELYRSIDNLLKEGLIIQAPHSIQEWSNYYLTSKGKEKVDELVGQVDKNLLKTIQSVVAQLSGLGFHKLLEIVYSEAPEFAVNSLAKGIITK